MIKSLRWLLLLISLSQVNISHAADTKEFIKKPDIATNAQLKAGTVINKSSISHFSEFLTADITELINRGDFTITIGPYTHFETEPNYIKATENFSTTVTLGAGNGDIENYVAGRPFPGEPSTDDKRMGEKLIWNMRYGYAPDETETLSMTWLYKDMSEYEPERTIEMYGALMRFNHRHSNLEQVELNKNPAELFSALYLQVFYPPDISNTQLLTYTKEDDAAAEQAWMYFNTQRRVRRLATSQKTDAFLGSDIMIEDFLGYNGRIRDMQWKYVGTEEMLLPMYRYDSIPDDHFELSKKGQQKLVSFNGSGQCFPAVTWQPRKVYKIKATPVKDDHPIAYRIFYLDAATYAPALSQIYDRTGKLWKLGIVGIGDTQSRGKEYSNWIGTVTDTVSMIDVQARHCTTLQFKIRAPEKNLDPLKFTAQYLRSVGR